MPGTPMLDAEVNAQLKNEENTKRKLITPIIEARWGNNSKIVMEYYFTNGRIAIDEYNDAHRGKQKKADYLLLYYNNIPLAIVEAKGENHQADEGYNQAIDYARLLDVPFAYATNGKDLIEKDMIAGTNAQMKMGDFPYPEDLWNRYVTESKLSTDAIASSKQPYFSGVNAKVPRYYQRNAINRIMRGIAEGKKRMLLVMATGTGKTQTSFQFIWRYWKYELAKGNNPKVLYLADRNILIDQTIKKDFRPFDKSMVKVNGDQLDTSYEIYLGLYQQLTSAHEDYYRKLPRDFFDLIVVDECHRGSASDDSKWRRVLDYFNKSIQVGMTATPKDGGIEEANNALRDAVEEYQQAIESNDQRWIKKASEAVGSAQDKLEKAKEESSIAYFGDPIYEYSLRQGIEDGFLAPYKVIAVRLDIDEDGYYPEPGTIDINGEEVISRLYVQKDFDRNIIVDERRERVAERITEFLKTNNARYEKTIVFCENVEHARAMVRLLENLNSDLVAEDSRYIMQITGDNQVGKDQLDNFEDPNSKYPVIAVTSKLLSTGVDVETCKNVVLDKTIGSMTEFKQIIGRGTRVKEEYTIDDETFTKMFFNILDFRSNYLKFSDPAFDGDPVQIVEVPDGTVFPKPPIKPADPKTPGGGTSVQKVAHMNGIDVNIIGEMVEYADKDGHLVRTNLDNCIRNNILAQYPLEKDFAAAWKSNSDKRNMAYQLLLETEIKEWETNYETRYGYKIDVYDILRKIAYDMDPPMPKKMRCTGKAVYDFMNGIKDDDIRRCVPVLLKSYQTFNFDVLRDPNIFNLPHFADIGVTMIMMMRKLGGRTGYNKFLTQLENVLYTE